MTRTSTRTRRLAALVALSALLGFDAVIANHFILPCRDDCTSPRWVLTGSLATARELHTATLLPNGKVLVAGGRTIRIDADGHIIQSRLLDSAELYDPATGTWSVTASMSIPRMGHTATPLPDGTVLVVGGATGGPPRFDAAETAEIYDPATESWRPTGSTIARRFGHAAARLQDGRVLVAGGFDDDALASAEIYDLHTGDWSATGDLIDARYWHTLTLLADGRVLAARGSDQGDLWYNLTSAEVYDPTTEKWDIVPDSTLSSVFHTATPLPDGKVVFAGGYGGGDAKGVVNASSELFAPATLTRARAGDLLARRCDHAATLLPGGDVLIAGGTEFTGTVGNLRTKTLASAERFDPTTATWSSAGALNFARTRHTMTLLPDGSVLVVGGYSIEPDGVGQSLASVERYLVSARAATTIGPQRSTRPDGSTRASRGFAAPP